MEEFDFEKLVKLFSHVLGKVTRSTANVARTPVN